MCPSLGADDCVMLQPRVGMCRGCRKVVKTGCQVVCPWTLNYDARSTTHQIYGYVFSMYFRTNISLHSINRLVFITKTECLLRGTEWIFIYNSTFCPHSVFVCFVWIWEQTAIISLYSFKWLVFIIEECLLRGTDYGFVYNSTFCPHSVFMFCVDLRTNSDYFPIQH